jgi:hypothetical protein
MVKLSILILPLALFSIQVWPGQAQERTATVSGVVTLNGKPVRGGRVELLTQSRCEFCNYGAWTDDHGQFRIMHIGAGKYWISARAPGHILPGDDGTGRSGRSLDVTSGGELENIVLEIKGGAAIAGRITDAQGNPVADERVYLHRLDNDGKPHPLNFGGADFAFHIYQTDDRGAYRFYGLPKGRYLISAGAAERGNIASQFYPRVFYPYGAIESEAKVIEVDEGSKAADIDIIFTDPIRPPLGRDRTGEITVRLVTEDGVGLPGVSVNLFPVTGDGRRIDGSSGVWDTTDEDGIFTISERWWENAPSLYSIAVSNAKGYVPVDGGRNPVYRRTGNDMAISMIKGGVITGRITNAKEYPVGGAQVSVEMVRDARGKPIQGKGVDLQKSTDDRGIYRLYGLAPGTYLVFTRDNIADRFATQSATVPTYHPSSRRETATEVTVASGGEARDIDIRYSEDRGHIK